MRYDKKSWNKNMSPMHGWGYDGLRRLKPPLRAAYHHTLLRPGVPTHNTLLHNSIAFCEVRSQGTDECMVVLRDVVQAQSVGKETRSAGKRKLEILHETMHGSGYDGLRRLKPPLRAAYHHTLLRPGVPTHKMLLHTSRWCPRKEM